MRLCVHMHRHIMRSNRKRDLIPQTTCQTETTRLHIALINNVPFILLSDRGQWATAITQNGQFAPEKRIYLSGTWSNDKVERRVDVRTWVIDVWTTFPIHHRGDWRILKARYDRATVNKGREKNNEQMVLGLGSLLEWYTYRLRGISEWVIRPPSFFSGSMEPKD